MNAEASVSSVALAIAVTCAGTTRCHITARRRRIIGILGSHVGATVTRRSVVRTAIFGARIVRSAVWVNRARLRLVLWRWQNWNIWQCPRSAVRGRAVGVVLLDVGRRSWCLGVVHRSTIVDTGVVCMMCRYRLAVSPVGGCHATGQDDGDHG
jgi:hypothetical protein